jgi:hypothetical protein
MGSEQAADTVGQHMSPGANQSPVSSSVKCAEHATGLPWPPSWLLVAFDERITTSATVVSSTATSQHCIVPAGQARRFRPLHCLREEAESGAAGRPPPERPGASRPGRAWGWPAIRIRRWWPR